MTVDLRLGRYQDALTDVESVDCIVTDPPYSERTHDGQRHGRKDYSSDGTHILSHGGIPYRPWSEEDVCEFVDFWSPRTRGWFCAMTSHDLIHVYTEALEGNGRYVFAPVPCIQQGMNVRLAGDGPANWTVYLVVSRPRSKNGWKRGALPGCYYGRPHDVGENALDRSKRPCPGGKPLWMMQQIIRDYSNPGDLICDPCAGGGTTLVAAAGMGRRGVGAEEVETTFEWARERIDQAQKQTRLFA